MDHKRAIKINHHLYLDPHPAFSQKLIVQRIESVIRRLEAAIGSSTVMAELRALLPSHAGAGRLTDHEVVRRVAQQVVEGQAALQPAATPGGTGEVPWNEFLKVLGQHEGVVNHMYLDKKGVVTVGIGTALFNVSMAQAQPFVVVKTGQPATPAEIAAEFDDMKAEKRGVKGLLAYKYRFTLTLGIDRINELATRDAHDFEKQLAKEFPGYKDYPVEIKEVLIDMKYQLGGNLSQFKQFKKNLELAIQKKHVGKYWENAAKESYRRDAQKDRNDWTSAMILKAGGISQTGAAKSPLKKKVAPKAAPQVPQALPQMVPGRLT